MAADTIPEATVAGAEEQDPEVAINQGKRHLMVNDYNSAVSSLAMGCQLLAQRHGDTADELGEPYLYYGKALLYLAREEAGVLGLGVPGNEEAEGEEDDEEGDEGGEEGATENGEDGKKDEGEDKAESAKESSEKDDAAVEKKTEEKPQPETKKDEKVEEAVAGSSSSSAAGSSKVEMVNGGASTSGLNGHAAEGEEEGAESTEEEESSNLQLAWEVLELAKLIILKRGPDGWKLLADVHRFLGEVAMESGNQEGALTDLSACLDLLKKLEKIDPRTIAETYYQLGLAYSLGNEFDSSIEQFTKATTLLEERIKELETRDKSAPASDDPNYTVEHEIKELKELLPDIREKISDMKDFKQEACKAVIENIKKQAAGGVTNGAGPSSAPDSSSPSANTEDKPASDISHLVRKKRKPEEELAESASPCKKPTPEKV